MINRRIVCCVGTDNNSRIVRFFYIAQNLSKVFLTDFTGSTGAVAERSKADFFSHIFSYITQNFIQEIYIRQTCQSNRSFQ